jgi:MarR family 2-MHQ and catechol resistance regulon transcriptional repressor
MKYLDIKILPEMTRTTSRAGTPDLSGTHLWLVMMKAHRALQRLAIQSIESFEVGLSEFGVLEMLLHKGPQPVNEIGRRIGLTSGAITAAVDRLESCKLVARGAHPTDRRTRVVRLTASGRAQATRIFAGHKRAMDSAARGLSEDERATLIRLLKKVGTSVEERRTTNIGERNHAVASDSQSRP